MGHPIPFGHGRQRFEIEIRIDGIPDGYRVTSPVVIEAGQLRAFGTIYAEGHALPLNEEQAGAIKTQLAERDEEIKRLKKENAGGGAMMAQLKKAQGEQKKLSELLKSRKTEMDKLQAKLAAAEKKALDLPVLIKARDDLQGKLTKSEGEYKKLAQDRARLEKALADSNRTLDGSHTMKKGETMKFRYRVLLHKGNAEQAGVAGAFEKYKTQ